MGEKNKAKSGFARIDKVLDQVLRAYRQRPDMALQQIWMQWDQTVGEKIAANAQPSAFKGSMLIVNVSSSVWLHQLQFEKADIIGKLNQAFGKQLVDDIRFKVGEL